MKKTALGLMIITVAAKIFGFVRDITLSYFYGVSYISDAYLISLTIPMVIFEIIGTGIKTSYIPVYSLIKKEKGLNLANKFTNNTINFIIAISSIVVVVVLLYTVPIVKLFAVGFEGSVLSLVVCFTKISIFAIYFYSLIYIFSGFLQMKNNFIVPAIMGIPLNFFIIIFIVISSKYNIVFLSIGTLIAVLAQLIFLIPFVYKKGYRYKFILNMKDYYLKKMFFLAIPAI
ncbi:MAG: murein biosynthesis integral membrane protein MurJ, partial [Clostridia bacterium]|nr:murein biosynthesis integral membrane protein MurJ [Clostridia bacterium]